MDGMLADGAVVETGGEEGVRTLIMVLAFFFYASTPSSWTFLCSSLCRSLSMAKTTMSTFTTEAEVVVVFSAKYVISISFPLSHSIFALYLVLLHL